MIMKKPTTETENASHETAPAGQATSAIRNPQSAIVRLLRPLLPPQRRPSALSQTS
jgi:hypothetical protein